MKVYKPIKGILAFVFISNICFACVKETSHGTHTKQLCFIE